MATQGGGNGNPIQYSCLGNPIDRSLAAWSHKEWVVTEHVHPTYKAFFWCLDQHLQFQQSEVALQRPCQDLNNWINHFGVSLVCLVAQSYPTLCDPWTVAWQAPLFMRDSPGKNTGVGFHVLLQGIFPTQGSNLGLLHCRQILYHPAIREAQKDVGSTRI